MPVDRPNYDPPMDLHVRVPRSIFNKVKLLLLDPVAGRVRYGYMSSLVTSLLRQWLKTMESDVKTPDAADKAVTFIHEKEIAIQENTVEE